jgi:hypothetical protein
VGTPDSRYPFGLQKFWQGRAGESKGPYAQEGTA